VILMGPSVRHARHAQVMVAVWEVSLLLALPFLALFLAVDGAYWSANIIKVRCGVVRCR
jgi:hypothetical protein